MPNTTTYMPGLYFVCRECGQVSGQHHSDGRCYTADELANRLIFYERTRCWPGPDEGCAPQREEPPDA
jgi:hypothetical protein